MREIKFRAWSAFEESMSYDVTLFANGWIEAVFPNGYEAKYVENVIPVMQYTGLTDCNGVEIYEGDIVTGKRDSHWHGGYDWVKGEVCFSDYNLSFNVDGIGGGALFNIEDIEIIGNIYENPESLENNE
jgi:uncharacterized phage protein (TIGR01671 family)